jgi:hypothetical protein
MGGYIKSIQRLMSADSKFTFVGDVKKESDQSTPERFVDSDIGTMVELPTGEVTRVRTIDGEIPDMISARRGPYNAYVFPRKTENGFSAQLPIAIQQRRPAFLPPNRFVNIDGLANANVSSPSQLKQVI